MPRFNGRQESPACHFAHANLTRTSMLLGGSHAGRFPVLLALGKTHLCPTQVLGRSCGVKQVNALEARSEQFIATIAIPVERQDAVHHAERLIDQVWLPSRAAV